MKLPFLLAALALASTTAVACGPYGSYRVVKKTPTGGEVALEHDQTLARQKAEAYMKAECPGGYQIVEEGEVAVGQTTDSNAQHSRTLLFNNPQTNTRSVSRDVNEWRVKYQCGNATTSAPLPAGEGAAPAAPGAPAAPAPATKGANGTSAQIRELRIPLRHDGHPVAY